MQKNPKDMHLSEKIAMLNRLGLICPDSRDGKGVQITPFYIGPSEVGALSVDVAGRTQWPLSTAFFLSSFYLFSSSLVVTSLREVIVLVF